MHIVALMRNSFTIATGPPALNRRGLWIALYGPDGAGKSAVAHRLAAELAAGFTSIELHHLRIQLGQACSPTSAPVTSPHAEPSRGLALSCLKLLYMLAHAWLSHWRVTVPSTKAGSLVIFDRYFLDYTIDPRRYRLHPRSIGFASLLGRMAPRPDLQFVLDVPAGELQRRKAEVSLAESERQRHEYANGIGSLPESMVVNAALPVSEVVVEIMGKVREYPAARSDVLSEPNLVTSDLHSQVAPRQRGTAESAGGQFCGL